MSPNPILEEIYAARDELLAKFGGDVHAYVEDARRRLLASGRPIALPASRLNTSHSSDQVESLGDGKSSVAAK